MAQDTRRYTRKEARDWARQHLCQIMADQAAGHSIVVHHAGRHPA